MSDPLAPSVVEPEEVLPPGAHVGPYVVERVLGAGMFGTVYAARHPVIENTVAIKILHRRYSSDPEMIARFVDEARAASHIEHSGIVKVYDFGRLEDGRRYTVMEQLVGEGLDALLARRGALEPDEALAILEPLARALAAAHAAGVAHRDVKPGNIFLCEEGGPKLLDFGVAKLLGMPSDAERTATGVAVGTPAYMAPEQCLGVGVGPAVDVYALGVLAFRMLTGRLPFDVDGSVLMMAAHLNDPPPWLHGADPRFGRAPGRVVRQMMAKRPEQRPDPVEGIAALSTALDGPRGQRWPIAALLLAGLMALAVAAIVVRTGSEEAPSATAESHIAQPTRDAPVDGSAGRAAADASPPDGAPDAHPGAGESDAAPTGTPALDAGWPTVARITLDNLPKTAQVTADGAPLTVIGGAIEVPRGDAALELELSAAGHRTVTLSVVPDADKTIDGRLPRLRRAPAVKKKPDPHGIDDW